MDVAGALRRASESVREEGRRPGAAYYEPPPVSREEVSIMIADALETLAYELEKA